METDSKVNRKHKRMETEIKVSDTTRKMESEIKLQDFKLTGVTEEKEEELGHGAYGTVVKLCFRGLKCAGKRFHHSLYTCRDDEQREALQQRWYKECTTLSTLRHPNVVQFLGIHFEGGDKLPMLVMEFVPFTLSGHIERHGTFPPEISYGILVDVAKALCYLHGGNPVIIHRDLTANNVLLTSAMRAKVSDLGTAKIIDITPAQKFNMSKCPGTLCYMPPEALTHNPIYSTDIDCFSYGVLILHIFCGQWPFPDEHSTISEDGKLIARSEVERRGRYLRRCGQDHPLRNLTQNCLHDVGSNRPDATEILKSVQRAAKQHPIQFESLFALLQEINSLTQCIKEANSMVSKQHKEYCDQLAAALSEYDEWITELLKETERIVSKRRDDLDSTEGDTVMKQTPTQAENEDYRIQRVSEVRQQLQVGISDANVRKSIGMNVLRLHLSLLWADRCQLASALKLQKAKTDAEISTLEKIIEMKGQEQENLSSKLKLKNEELEANNKEICELQAVNKKGEDKVRSMNNELNFIKEENKAIRKEVKAMKLLLEAQLKSIDEMTKQLKEKEKQLSATNTQVQLATKQIEVIQNKLEVQRKQSEANEKSLHESATQQANLLDITKVKMEIMSKHEIPDLKSQLDTKDGMIQELLKQHKRAQQLLAKRKTPTKCSVQLKFELLANLPMAMSDLQCALIEDRVYVGGGTGDDKSDHISQSQIFEYIQSTDEWILLTRNSTRFFGLVGYKGKLVTIGGMSPKHSILGDVNIFDFTTKSWDSNEIPPIATQRYYPTVISHCSRLAVLGGVTTGGSTTDKVEVLIEGQWHRVPSLPHRICLVKPVLFGKSLYLFGGLFSHNPEAPSKAVISIPLSKLFTPPVDKEREEKAWKIHSSEESATLHYRSAAANFGGMLFAIGGWSPELLAPTTDIVAYSMTAEMWVKVDDLPQPRYSCGTTPQLQNGEVMVVGGIEKTADVKKRSSNVLLVSLAC